MNPLVLSETNIPYKEIDHEKRKYASSLRGKIAIIEGTISAGKSTLTEELKSFAKKHEIKVRHYPEPLIPELLNLFLDDQKKYAFAFQLTMLTMRKSIYREAAKAAKAGYFCIIDRSMHGDYCFANMHRQSGNINEAEWKVYLNELSREKFDAPDYLLFLDVTPEEAIKRSVIRNRDGEDKYNLGYFKNLSDIYNSVIPQSPNKGYIKLDWNIRRTKEEILLPVLNAIKNIYDNTNI